MRFHKGRWAAHALASQSGLPHRTVCGIDSWHNFDVRIEQTGLADVLLLTGKSHRDNRGFFTRTFDAALFDEHVGAGASHTFVQDSQSRSVQGVLRGMHGRSGRGEAKLVRCARGSVYDVLVDIRRDSPTFRMQEAFVLDDSDFRQLYIPPGFLNGFQALTPEADVCYRIDRPHDPAEDISINPYDVDLAIDWPQPVSHISERDSQGGSWRELLEQLG